MNTLDFTRSLLLAVVVAGVPILSVHAQTSTQAPPVTATAHELANETETVTATVTQIDYQTRLVTLRTTAGKEDTVEVGPAAKRFDQIKVGDKITMTYQHAVALELLPADSAQAGTEVEGGITRDEKSSKPGGTAEQAVTVTAKLTAVDLKKHTVTLTGADGKTRVIEVKDPARQARLSKLKVGDMVRITYAEALAVTVNPS
jgi:Cu/Ag efflux protein CusF